jgi:vacuolar-type H+-ATPase subunit I/STV1
LSRFFRGDGRRYRPLSFSLPTAAGGERPQT